MSGNKNASNSGHIAKDKCLGQQNHYIIGVNLASAIISDFLKPHARFDHTYNSEILFRGEPQSSI